ncbi:DNA polymerase, partial [Escherichia coli]|uniref:DNA polymerase n=1 Tax=Escherichia coli TaxID=562 RepID=UPI0039FBB480
MHHRLNTCATVTGRLSASSPNLQNLPRDGTSAVKQMFTSRFGESGRITEVDYSALEVVMSCVHTGDRKLLGLLQAGTDMHCYRLAFREELPYEEVY